MYVLKISRKFKEISNPYQNPVIRINPDGQTENGPWGVKGDDKEGEKI